MKQLARQAIFTPQYEVSLPYERALALERLQRICQG